MATNSEVLKIMVILGNAYPVNKLEKTSADLYITLLEDIPGEILLQGVLEHIAHSAWFPTIAELREAACTILEGVDPAPDAHQAWAEVLAELERVGSYAMTYGEELRFSHPLVREVVDQFGWLHLCRSENTIADRAHFVQAYTERLKHRRRTLRQLPSTQQLIASKQCQQGQLPEAG